MMSATPPKDRGAKRTAKADRAGRLPTWVSVFAGLIVAVGAAEAYPAAVPQAEAGELHEILRSIIEERKEDLDPVVNRLVYLDCEQAAERVAGLLRHPHPSVRAKAVWVLGFLNAPETAKALVGALTDFNWEVRRDAVYALGRLEHRDASGKIAERLHDASREVRLEAARVLGAFADPSSSPMMRRALEKGAGDIRLEVALLNGLGLMQDDKAISLARKRLAAEDDKLRAAALRMLVRLDDEEAQSKLVALAGSKDPETRREAATLFGAGDEHWAVPRLEQMLLEETSTTVALAAAESLAGHGRESGLRYLAEVSAAGDPRVSATAAEALGRLGVTADDLLELRRKAARKRLASSGLKPDVLAAELAALGLPFTDRLLALSELFLGVPYRSSPLGEGAGVDPGPLYRWDAVDCLTFVEQVLALANTSRSDQVLPLLIDLRYQEGSVAYGQRNHLMEHQWLPGNAAKGWFRDITEEIGEEAVVTARKEITAESWANRRGADLPLEANEIPLGVSELPIIPIDKLGGLVERIPDGAILVVVRHDIPSRPFRVTHLGIVVRKEGRPHLRHAARATYKSVIDEDLNTFVLRNKGYRSWPVAGFNIILPEENTRRAAELLE